MSIFIEITESMKENAITTANKAIRMKKAAFTKDNSKENLYRNKLVGFLGEEVFRKSLENHSKYFNEDLNVLKDELKKTYDLYDFITSKTEESIDIKTTNSKRVKSLSVRKDIYDWRPIDYYVFVRLYPLENNYKKFNIEEITHGEIVGCISGKELSTYQDGIYYKANYYKLKNKELDSLYEKFYNKDEVILKNKLKEVDFINLNEQALFIEASYNNIHISSSLLNDCIKKDFFPEVKTYITETYQKNKKRNSLTNLKFHTKTFSVRDKIAYLSYNLTLEKDGRTKTTDIYALIRNLRRTSVLAEENHLSLLYILNKNLHNEFSINLIKQYLKYYPIEIYYTE